MALWQFSVLAALVAALIGTLLCSTSVLVRKISSTNATLRRIEEDLVSANHRAAQSLLKPAQAVSASPSETLNSAIPGSIVDTPVSSVDTPVSGVGTLGSGVGTPGSSVSTPGYLTIRDLKMISGAAGSVIESSPVMHHDRRMSLQRRMELDRRNGPERRINSERSTSIDTCWETGVDVDVVSHASPEVAEEPCVSAAATNLAPVAPVTPVVSESPVPLESRAVPEGAVLPVASVGEEGPTSIPQSQAGEPNGQRVEAVGLSASGKGAIGESENQDGLDRGDLSSQPTASMREDSVTAISESDQSPPVNNDPLRPAAAIGEDAAAKRNQEMYLFLSNQRRRRRARGG